jgi:hypothetical protein
MSRSSVFIMSPFLNIFLFQLFFNDAVVLYQIFFCFETELFRLGRERRQNRSADPFTTRCHATGAEASPARHTRDYCCKALFLCRPFFLNLLILS